MCKVARLDIKITYVAMYVLRNNYRWFLILVYTFNETLLPKTRHSTYVYLCM